MLSKWINGYLIELIEGFLQGAWKMLDMFLLTPTDFKSEGTIGEIQLLILGSCVGLTTLFLIFALMKEMTKRIGGYSNRSNTEIISKAVLSMVFAYTAPWLMLGVALKISNAISEIFIGKKLNLTTMKKVMEVTDTAGSAIVIAALALTICFIILSFQNIVRYGNLTVLFVLAPFSASTMVNEDMNTFPAWWREVCAIVFTQPLQLMILYLIINLIGSGQKIEDYFQAIGLMVVLIISPGWLRKLLFSTGSGKTMMNAAGGAGRMAMYRLMMKR